MEDLTGQIIGDAISPTEWNHFNQEFKNVVSDTGQTPLDTNEDQLGIAISDYVHVAGFWTVGGTAAAITLTIQGSRQEPFALATGLTVSFRPTTTATGATTLTVGALALKNLVRPDNTTVKPGDWDATNDVTARYDGTSFRLVTLPLTASTVNVNLVENGDFVHWSHMADQDLSDTRLVTSLTDIPGGGNDEYDTPIDRWRLISDGNDVVDVRRFTGMNQGDDLSPNRSALQLRVNTAGQKFGLVQNMEHQKCAELLQDTAEVVKCSLSFWAAADGAGTIDELKAAVVSHVALTGIDDFTGGGGTNGSFITAWNIDGTIPTLDVVGQTSAFENTPSVLAALTGEFKLYTIEDITISASNIDNLSVMIWVDDAAGTAIGTNLWISGVKLEKSSVATPFVKEPTDQVQYQCLRHYVHFGHQEFNGVADGQGAVLAGGTGIDNEDQLYTTAFPVRFSRIPATSDCALGGALGEVQHFIDGTGIRHPTGIAFESKMKNSHTHLHMEWSDTTGARGRANAAGAGGPPDSDGWFDAGIHVRSRL